MNEYVILRLNEDLRRTVSRSGREKEAVINKSREHRQHRPAAKWTMEHGKWVGSPIQYVPLFFTLARLHSHSSFPMTLHLQSREELREAIDLRGFVAGKKPKEGSEKCDNDLAARAFL